MRCNPRKWNKNTKVMPYSGWEWGRKRDGLRFLYTSSEIECVKAVRAASRESPENDERKEARPVLARTSHKAQLMGQSFLQTGSRTNQANSNGTRGCAGRTTRRGAS